MIWSAAQYAPLFLMGALVGGAGMGFLAGASRLVASVATFSFVYHFNLYATASQLARETPRRSPQLMRSSFRATAWLTIGGALVVSLAAEPIITVIFGRDFGPAATSLAILIWTVPVMFLCRPRALVAHSGALEVDVFCRKSQVC